MNTTHALAFECRPWHIDDEWTDFRVGTCHGLYRAQGDAYEMLAIDNHEPHNGHFEDVMQWFEASCRRDGKALRFLEVVNERFGRHVVQKRGFIWENTDNLIKHFK